MACMDHVCSRFPDCKWQGSNNKAETPAVCPWCSAEVNHFYNERYDDHGEHDGST